MWKTDFQSITKAILLPQKPGDRWRLEKNLPFETKTEAIKAEAWIKRMKSRKIIKYIMLDTIDLKEIIAD